MVPNVRYICHNTPKKDGWTRKTQKTSVMCCHRLTFQEKRMPPSLSMLTIQASTAPEYSADTAGLVAQLFFSPRDIKPDVRLNYVKQNYINVSLNSYDAIHVWKERLALQIIELINLVECIYIVSTFLLYLHFLKGIFFSFLESTKRHLLAQLNILDLKSRDFNKITVNSDRRLFYTPTKVCSVYDTPSFFTNNKTFRAICCRPSPERLTFHPADRCFLPEDVWHHVPVQVKLGL